MLSDETSTKHEYRAKGAIPQELLSTLFDRFSDAFYLLDRELRVIFVNGQAAAHFQKPAEALLGKPIWESVPSNLGSVFERECRRAFEDGVPTHFAAPSLLYPERWIEFRAHPTSTGLAVYFLNITDTVHAFEERRSQALQLQTIIDSADPLIAYVGADLRFQVINKAFEQWIGVPRTEIVGRCVYAVLGESFRDAMGESLKRAEAGETVSLEHEGACQDKSHRHWHINFTPDFDRDGTLRGIIFRFRDISDQRRTESWLRDNEAYHRSLFDSAGVGNIEVDHSTDYSSFLRVNQHFCDMLGYSREELLNGMTFLDITHPDDIESSLKALSVLRREDAQSLHLEKRYIRKDGTVMWADVTPKLIRNRDGHATRRLVVVHDITELKTSEAALRGALEDRQKFESLADNSPEYVGMCDLDGMTTYINPAGLKLLGIDSLEEARTIPMIEFLFPEDHEVARNEIQPEVLRNGIAEREIRFRNRKTGEARWMIHTVFPLRDSGDNTVGFASVSRDITDRKRAEMLLQQADRRKDEFLATLAHELRNPLAPISYALQIWNRLEQDPAKAAQIRHMMARQVQQLQRLIDDLLDLSRISRGKIKLKKEYSDLASLLEGAIEPIRPFIETCQHTISIELPPAPLMIYADPGRLTQIIGNLVHNAAKYSDRNGSITISASSHKQDLVITITDTGVGIPSHMLSRIFEPFTQVNQSLDRAHGGLGIGLTLVKNLVELHGGTVEASSAGAGAGSVFTLRLPIVIEPSEIKDVESSSAEPLGEPARYRIVIVDDLKPSADTLALMLQELHQDVRVAYDARAALALIEEFKPDVVFSDIAMPGMDGYTLAKRLHSRRESPPYLIALTGYGQRHDQQRALDAGFQRHLVKPTDIAALRAVLVALAEPGSKTA
jgi:PAS domain S-box-containing protein